MLTSFTVNNGIEIKKRAESIFHLFRDLVKFLLDEQSDAFIVIKNAEEFKYND